MDLAKYNKVLHETHKSGTQTGFELNDRRVFIDELLGQLGYERDDILFDVSQRGKSPDIRLFGRKEKKTKNSMSRFVIETKNYGLLERDTANIDFLQLKNYLRNNAGRIRFIASTDYVSFFLFQAEYLINTKRLDLQNVEITVREVEEFKHALVREFDLTRMQQDDFKAMERLSQKSLFEEYDFPNPEDNSDRFDISKKEVRENFIRSLYGVMEEVREGASEPFYSRLAEFRKLCGYSQSGGESAQCVDLFMTNLNEERFIWIRNLFLWAIEMNYIPNFIDKPFLLRCEDIEKVLNERDASSNDYFYNGYLLTCIYSIINKTLFIRILEDSALKGKFNPFMRGEEDGRYLSNGVLLNRFLEGKLKEYVRRLFEFKNEDLRRFSFLLKHDIYDWVLDEIEESTLIDFLRVFNEIYLNRLDIDILGDIYEHYLQEDRDEEKGKSYRRLLGQYFTPRPIVRFMWLLTRDAYVKSHGRDIYDKNLPPTNVIDPFMGSGTFLNECVLQMKVSDSDRKIIAGEVFYWFKDRTPDRRIEESLVGFEINPLSCSIADINLYFRLIKSFSEVALRETPIRDLSVYRTDSFNLEAISEESNQLQTSLLAEDIRSTFRDTRRIRVAKENKYDIVISNPPYGITNPTAFMKQELIPFAFPKNNFDLNGQEIDYSRRSNEPGVIPIQERNRGKLRDMYGFAFGVADRLIKEDGVICFITSNTYLALPTYKYMRKYLLKNYSIEYVINFNRINEKANSMFSPEASIATAMIVMTKKAPDVDHKLRILDLSNLNSTKSKYDYFNEIEWKAQATDRRGIVSFRPKEISSLGFKEVLQTEFLRNRDYELIVIDPLLETVYKNSRSLMEFGNYQLGIQTSNDDVFVGTVKSEIAKKVEEYARSLGLDYDVGTSNILPYVEHEDVDAYSIRQSKYVYYDKSLERLIHKKAESEGHRASIWLREEKRIKAKVKLFVGESKFSVDNNGFLLAQNCIKSKNLYFLICDDSKILYYICGILNSRFAKYYIKNTQLDNYGTFPIKDPEANPRLFEKISRLSMEIHDLERDYSSLLSGRKEFLTDFFKESIAPRVETYRLDEPNDYFVLEIPQGIANLYVIDSPRINETEPSVVELNRSGLRLRFRNESMARIAFEDVLKNLNGDISETDCAINITRLDRLRFGEITDDIEQQVDKKKNGINMLVYCLYLDIECGEPEANEELKVNLTSSNEVRRIEAFLNSSVQ